MTFFPLFAVVLYILSIVRAQSVTGGSTCGTFLCVSATVNGSTTNYVLSTRETSKVGWLAIGFGDQMANTPMVIMWMNRDGSPTLSQRKASSEVMPTLDPNPPRLATFVPQLSVLSFTNPTLAFSIPSNSDQTQKLIYALGSTNPGSSSKTATLVQHSDYGILKLDLTKAVSPSATNGVPVPVPSGNPTSGGSNTGGGRGGTSIPLRPYQRMIIAHAIMCAIGFLVFLPAGALLARYARTFVPGPVWFKGHAALQFFIAGPIIFIGVILGIAAVGNAKAPHLNDDHKRWGLAIFILYLLQCGLGAFIHWVKKPNRVTRPPQNYIHAVVGLLVIALAFYQVHSGYDHEWVATTGRDPVSPNVNIVFWVWVVLMPVLYGAGLAFLPKQYRQETSKAHSPIQEYEGHTLRQTAYRRNTKPY